MMISILSLQILQHLPVDVKVSLLTHLFHGPLDSEPPEGMILGWRRPGLSRLRALGQPGQIA